ncbi:MAG: GHKL domain-containing protein [Planctomycetes bacterium]|nr:GHKL domain-containing protein [Planctomycetota bacterium]
MSSTSDEKKLYQQLKTLSSAFLLPSTRTLDHKSILRTVTKHFKAFTEADASVLMLNDNNENLKPVYSIGIPFSRVKDSKLSLSTRLKDIISRPALDARYASFMNTPLIHNRKFIGLSAVFSIVPEKFLTFEQDKYKNLLLTILASYFAVSIENVTLVDSIKSTGHSEFDWKHTFDSDQKIKWIQAIQAEKMPALSMLITEIAHEITNPLSLIASYTQTLLKDATEKNIHELTEIHEHANRAAGFVKQLLNFAEQDNFIKKGIDIHAVIEKAISLFTHKLEEQNIHLIREYDKSPLLTNCNSNQMELVFVNLISNALDAIESRGNIERILSVKTERKDKSIQIHLKDTGCGIPDENMKTIFEPFFTTKEAGKGTGLGLPICQKIIHEHGGNIQAFSQLGKGTTFTIELPQIETIDKNQRR